jgi:hypothetical protein
MKSEIDSCLIISSVDQDCVARVLSVEFFLKRIIPSI